MKNIIITGDSFCYDQRHDAPTTVWPRALADQLGLALHGQGFPGGHWWACRNYLKKLPDHVFDTAEVMVFVHTNAGRVPSLDPQMVQGDPSARSTEPELAVYLYHKYISDTLFAEWAQQRWFEEISQTWGHKKLCHLHAFPWTTPYEHLLSGLIIQPNLAALSLNELGTDKFSLISDTRSNHFNPHNNQALARELAHMISGNLTGIQQLNLYNFEQKTTRWLGWS
jgi:hypothetical protein